MPHRLPTNKCYRIADDVLLHILEKLDPVTLYRTCKAFQRVWLLVMGYKPLRYIFELAVVGMRDGAVPYSARSPLLRLKLLTAYKKDWPRLHWTHEQQVRVPAIAMKVDVSGNFLFHVGHQSLDLLELPSPRTSRPPAQTRHLRYITSAADCVAIDPIQSLIVASQTTANPNGQIVLRLKIRNLWTFDKHPRGSSANYECSTHISQPIAEVSTVICGMRIVVTLEFVGGLTKHLLMDWSSCQAMWLEEQDVVFLNPYQLLGVRKVNAPNKTVLYLYNISDMRNVAIEREYGLPPIWAKSTMRFARNNSPNSDHLAPSDALFYSDPSARVLVLMAKQQGPGATGMHWMFINESFFRPTFHPERRMVPWDYWSQFCLIRELDRGVVVGNPHVVGSRVVYLEKDGTVSAHGSHRSRLCVIDFAPYSEIPAPPAKLWTLVGKQSSLRPSETRRDFPPESTKGLAVESIRATEDNVVLVLENYGDLKPVNILTFGV